jgi:hypothetical protein
VLRAVAKAGVDAWETTHSLDASKSEQLGMTTVASHSTPLSLPLPVHGACETTGVKPNAGNQGGIPRPQRVTADAYQVYAFAMPACRDRGGIAQGALRGWRRSSTKHCGPRREGARLSEAGPEGCSVLSVG